MFIFFFIFDQSFLKKKKRHLSHTSSFIIGGHACRRSMSIWKSSHFWAASNSSWKRAYRLSSFSTSSIWTWEKGIERKQGVSKANQFQTKKQTVAARILIGSFTQVIGHEAHIRWTRSVQRNHLLPSNTATCVRLWINVMINASVLLWEVHLGDWLWWPLPVRTIQYKLPKQEKLSLISNEAHPPTNLTT